MTRIRNLFCAIGLAVFVILAMAFDALPLDWLAALAVVAVACVGGAWATTYAMRNS